MQSPSEVRDAFKLLLIASAVILILAIIPFAEIITYPLRLFVTYVHEIGHALAARATLGEVREIELDWYGNGLTMTYGGWGLLISSAGYLSTTLYGSALLLLLRRARNARFAAIGTGVVLLVMTVLFGGNLLAWLTGAVGGAGLILLALKARPRVTHFFMSFLAVQSVLNAFYDLRTLMYLSAFDSSRPTDAQNMAEATGGFVPAIVWAVGWSVLSFVMLAATLFIYYRSLQQRSAVAEMPVAGLISESSRSATGRRV